MDYNENFEKIFFMYSIKNVKYLNVTREGFYKNKEIDGMAFLARKFYDKFKESPSKDQMNLLIENSKYKKIITSDIVKIVYNENINNYDEDWLRSTAESWIKWRNFDISLMDGIEYVKTTKVSPESVEHIINKFKDTINNRNKLNFDKDLGLDFYNPLHHYQKNELKIKSGKTFVDNLTGGGYDSTGLTVYAGEQNIGKCLTHSQHITLRNKKTGKITSIQIGDFFNLIKNQSNEKK